MAAGAPFLPRKFQRSTGSRTTLEVFFWDFCRFRVWSPRQTAGRLHILELPDYTVGCWSILGAPGEEEAFLKGAPMPKRGGRHRVSMDALFTNPPQRCVTVTRQNTQGANGRAQNRHRLHCMYSTVRVERIDTSEYPQTPQYNRGPTTCMPKMSTTVQTSSAQRTYIAFP